MKNALIIHGTSANPHSNWFDWLKELLEKSGYKTWVPQMPGAESPDMERYRKFIFGDEWQFNDESLVIGHSSGAVTVLSLLENLPEGTQIDTAVMVGVYRPDKRGFSTGNIDVEKIKGKAKRFVFVHSDDDPFCPLQDAEYFTDALGGELKVYPGNQHFSYEQDTKHNKLPALVEILDLSDGEDQP